jgi:hypothetical protein
MNILYSCRPPTTTTTSSSSSSSSPPCHGWCLPSPLFASGDRSYQVPHPVLSSIPVSTIGSTIAHQSISFIPAMGIFGLPVCSLRMLRLVLSFFHPYLRDIESVAADQRLVRNVNCAAIIFSRGNSHRSVWESGSPGDGRNLSNPLAVVVTPLPPSLSLPILLLTRTSAPRPSGSRWWRCQRCFVVRLPLGLALHAFLRFHPSKKLTVVVPSTPAKDRAIPTLGSCCARSWIGAPSTGVVHRLYK